MAYQTILVEQRGRVGIIQLNRPKALNAINQQLTQELIAAAEAFDQSRDIGCMLVRGSESVFAAGADVKEMQNADFVELYLADWFAAWQRFSSLHTPKIAAVAGYALGGGCELAMMCDFIIAASDAKFGQPEIKLGLMPGMGGSQRLAKLVGRAKAMEMCLTGRLINAQEAERSGLVARVVDSITLEDEAFCSAQIIANMSLPVAMMVREAVGRAEETSLQEGLLFERRLFQSLFAFEDCKEGLTAFVEKRSPVFKHC